MSTQQEMYAKYEAQLKALGETVDAELLMKITKGLGPANFNADAQAVAASDEAELKRVYTNFVADELAVKDEVKGMAMVHAVAKKMQSEKKKYRAVFYYLLSKHA